MRLVVQRVSNASCLVNEEVTGKINNGLLLFVGFKSSDTKKDIEKLASKVAKLRIFSDENDKMNLNISQVNGEVLSISQFTLYGSLHKTNRPSFTESMNYDIAEEFYSLWNKALINLGLIVKEGIFGADMKISLLNDGPVTILLDTETL